jgi:hypothetical protein
MALQSQAMNVGYMCHCPIWCGRKHGDLIGPTALGAGLLYGSPLTGYEQYTSFNPTGLEWAGGTNARPRDVGLPRADDVAKYGQRWTGGVPICYLRCETSQMILKQDINSPKRAAS